MKERFESIRVAVELQYDCPAVYEGSVPVKEMFGNRLVWEGIVSWFALKGYPKAKRCYAWSFKENGETKYTTVLELPPVYSPESAVRVAIAAKAYS